jgi:hypothetical protein
LSKSRPPARGLTRAESNRQLGRDLGTVHIAAQPPLRVVPTIDGMVPCLTACYPRHPERQKRIASWQAVQPRPRHLPRRQARW